MVNKGERMKELFCTGVLTEAGPHTALWAFCPPLVESAPSQFCRLSHADLFTSVGLVGLPNFSLFENFRFIRDHPWVTHIQIMYGFWCLSFCLGVIQ